MAIKTPLAELTAGWMARMDGWEAQACVADAKGDRTEARRLRSMRDALIEAVTELRDAYAESIGRTPAVEPAPSETRAHLLHCVLPVPVLPVPECCDTQMHLAGNMSLHVLGYQCLTCWRRMRVTATFAEGWPDIDPETLASTDTTP